MAQVKSQLNINTGQGQAYNMSMSDQYTEVFQTKSSVDNSDAFTNLATIAKTGVSALKGSKVFVIKNNSDVPVEILFNVETHSDSSNIDQYSADAYITQILAANEFMVMPNQYMVGYNAAVSAGNAKTINNSTGYAVASTLEVDSTADVDTATDGAIASGSTTTTLYLEPYTSAANCTANLFRVGDLIRLENEICEVTAIGDKSDLANNYLTIRRGLHGSTAATHADDVSVDLPFFNSQSDFDAFTYAQTNSSGRFTATNLFGYGRSLTYPTGIVKGSFSMKFYNQGYQELGLSGLTSASNSGLTASTAYQFNITVDGSGAYALSFTADASDLSIGKVLSLIQAQFDAAYYASSGNLKNERVSIGLVGGDIRVTSGQRTSASAVLLADSSGGDTDIWGVGIFPAVGDVETAIPAKLPDDSIYTKEAYLTLPNKNAFTYDNGKGNLIGGEASGSINYETGALDFTGPANAEFAVSFNYDSAHSGGINATNNQSNAIRSIAARSLNSKLNAEVELLGFV